MSSQIPTNPLFICWNAQAPCSNKNKFCLVFILQLYLLNYINTHIIWHIFGSLLFRLHNYFHNCSVSYPRLEIRNRLFLAISVAPKFSSFHFSASVYQNANELKFFCPESIFRFFGLFCPVADFIWQDSYLYNRLFCFQSSTDVVLLSFFPLIASSSSSPLPSCRDVWLTPLWQLLMVLLTRANKGKNSDWNFLVVFNSKQELLMRRAKSDMPNWTRLIINGSL